MAGDGKIGLWPVVAIGVGGMVGGGIFAVLGLAVQLAHGGTPLAFLIAGAVALLTAYFVREALARVPGQGRNCDVPQQRVRPRPHHWRPQRAVVAQLHRDALAVFVRVWQLRRDLLPVSRPGRRQARAHHRGGRAHRWPQPAQRTGHRQGRKLDRRTQDCDPRGIRGGRLLRDRPCAPRASASGRR